MYRRYRVPSVWRDMDRLQNEMNRLFEAYTPSRMRQAPGFPSMNVWSNDDGLVVTAEIPGIHPDDIEISVVGETLTVSGERKPDEIPDENSRYHRQERGYGKFTRSLQLPFPVNVAQVEAIFKNGLLQITMPRTEEDKPRKITVKTV